MRVISLDQPWAQMLVTRQPHTLNIPPQADAVYPELRQRFEANVPMVKRIETRSWPCPPNLIGERIAFHATKHKPEFTAGPIGDYVVEHSGQMRRVGTDELIDLPLGAIVGSGIVKACLPIVESTTEHDDEIYSPWRQPEYLYRQQVIGDPYIASNVVTTDISDQRPYGDFTPGRFAWIIGDAAPTTERCPVCWGSGVGLTYNSPRTGVVECPCEVCDRQGHCDPIPAKGQQRIWAWTPHPRRNP